MTVALNRAERRKAQKLERSAGRRPGTGRVGHAMTLPLHQVLANAVAEHGKGNLDVAEPVYRQILAQHPDQPDALQYLGVLLHQRGTSDEGIDLLRKATTTAPSNAEIYGNFASVLAQSGRFRDAEDAFRQALRLDPSKVNVWMNLIRLLSDRSSIDDGLAACLEALAHLPESITLLKCLGETRIKMLDYQRAAEAFTRCIELDSEDAGAMNDLAVCLRELGRYDEAEEVYKKAIAIAPDMLELRYNYSAFLSAQGRIDQAKEHLEKVLASKQENWMTVTMLAVNLGAMGREDEAIKMMQDVANSHPNDAIVWNDIGAQLVHLGRFEEAKTMFERAIELDPDRVEAQTNLGNCYTKMERGYDAVREYEKALKIRPMHLAAHVALCRMLKEVYRLDEANIYAHATIHLPGYGPRYFTNPLQIFRSTCDYKGLEELGDVWENMSALPSEDAPTGLLQLVCYAESPEEIQKLSSQARRSGVVMEQKASAKPLPVRPKRPPHKKLRIGLLSSDLRYHSVSRFALPLGTQYDREQMEMHCYTPIRMPHDAIQQQYIRSVDKFTYVDNKTDRQIAEIIQSDDIDILLELNGYTQGSRLMSCAYRPAPVQISWLGYPFTTGLEDMDYLLVDKYFKPEDNTGLVEEPLVMNGSWVCFGEGLLFDPVEINPVPPVERHGVVTFGTLNNSYKFTPKMIALWAEVMKRVPDSRFLVVRPETASVLMCRNLAEEFGKNGIGADRIYYINNRGKSLPHLAYYNEIDISLDTFPLTGGTTTCEALWMGVPVVTLAGPALHQRISYALLKHCGIDECCALTPEDYVEKAVALTENLPHLRELKASLRGALQSSPLAQPKLFLENFTATMQEVAERHGLR